MWGARCGGDSMSLLESSPRSGMEVADSVLSNIHVMYNIFSAWSRRQPWISSRMLPAFFRIFFAPVCWYIQWQRVQPCDMLAIIGNKMDAEPLHPWITCSIPTIREYVLTGQYIYGNAFSRFIDKHPCVTPTLSVSTLMLSSTSPACRLCWPQTTKTCPSTL